MADTRRDAPLRKVTRFENGMAYLSCGHYGKRKVQRLFARCMVCKWIRQREQQWARLKDHALWLAA